jgi:hypothetical protein
MASGKLQDGLAYPPRAMRAERASSRLTKAKMKRALDVAREKGFRVVVKLDGTLVFEKDSNPQADDKPLEQEPEIIL